MEQILQKVHGSGRSCIAIHPSSEYVCIGGWDGFIKQYSYGLSNKSLSISNAMDSSSQYHDDPIHQISFCQSGDYFAICCEDGEAVLFRHPDCSVCSTLCKYDCAVSSIAFLPATHSFLLAMSSDHGTIKMVNALDCNTNHYEFNACTDGIRHIKFIPFAPDPFTTAREKYLAVAQCDGTFALWKLFKRALFDPDIKEMNQKVVQAHQFKDIFPKIKGGDVNQRLEFDSTKDGHLIAIPGNANVKILDTKNMKMKENISIAHRNATNCCVFNHYLESADTTEYILASSDIGGHVFISCITCDDDTFECKILDEIPGDAGICSIIWKSSTELLVTTMNSDVYKYTFEPKQPQPLASNNNHDDAAKKEEELITNKKKTDSDSEEDFDIDMDDGTGAPSPTKKVLKRSFEDSDSDASTPPPPTPPGNDVQDSVIAAVPDANPVVKENALETELAAAAEMFGDDLDAEEDMIDTNQIDDAATDMMMEDTGEDLDDFIVDKHKKEKEEDLNQNGTEYPLVQDTIYEEPFAHEPFVNGQTLYDEAGQRYLLFNKIGAVMVRKQDVSSNAMEMSNIMNSLHHGKYCIEIDFFDKWQYSRAVTIKSDHHFTCCDMNAHGLLLGSQPSTDGAEDDIKQSIVRYKPIARNGEYRSFCSEKDCEWNHRLPIGETCISVGLTPKYALIATNKRFLRILSIGGLQVKHVISLPKNVVHMTGTNNDDPDCNTIVITFDDLSLWILDLNENKKLYDGYCAVTNNTSCVTRVFVTGTQEHVQVVTVDSEHVVRVLCKSMFDWNWMAVLDVDQYLSTKYPDSEVATERPKGIWPVYFDGEEQCLMVMELKHLDYPIPSQNNGSCVLTNYKFSVPLMGVGVDEIDPMTNEPIIRFENREEGIMTKALLHQLDDSRKEKQNKKKLLKEYITLFNHSCKVNQQVLAYDIALHFLDSEKALSNAIKVAMHHELPLLAEQITNLTKQRMNSESGQVDDDDEDEGSNKENKNKRKNKVNAPSDRRRFGYKVNDVTTSMKHAKLTGKKRKNPGEADESPFAKKPKRNPFSCNTRSENDKKKITTRYLVG
eukprot:202439_1